MKKEDLIKKIKNTFSVVDFYDLKQEILNHLEENEKGKKKNVDGEKQ